MMRGTFTVRIGDWAADAAALRDIRTRVFIEEQGVPEALEWDGEDAGALHVLAQDATGRAIGTGRLLLHGECTHLGRMAVLPAWRAQGVGAAVLARLLDAARESGASRVVLNAQTHAVGFYRRAGFLVEGTPFLDAGIPHLRMIRSVSP